MIATTRLRDEHDRILRQASLVAGLAGSRLTPDVADEIVAALATLNAFLVGHLAAEDDWMYPLLMAADDNEVRGLAVECVEDMGGLQGAWSAYRDFWRAEAIRAAPARFRSATEGILSALALRIERENEVLYPLVDRLSGSHESAHGPMVHPARGHATEPPSSRSGAVTTS